MLNNLEEIEKEYNLKSSEEWYNLEEGDNKCRIVSDALVLAKHYNPETKESFVCYGKENGCPYCAKEDKPRIKFLCYVIDRSDSTIKIASFGYSIIKAIKKFKDGEEYGFKDLPPYDMTINKTKTGSRKVDVEYTVMAGRNNIDITEEEKEKIDKLKPIEGIIETMKAKQIEKDGIKESSND